MIGRIRRNSASLLVIFALMTGVVVITSVALGHPQQAQAQMSCKCGQTASGQCTQCPPVVRRTFTKECSYPQGYPGPGVTITSARIYKRPVDLPEGRAWKIHGHVDGVVDCNIKQGFIQITIQRHTKYGRSPHVIYRWQTVSGSRVTHNLNGQNIGDTFSMVVPGEVCQGIAEYRFRIHMSDLILKDNSTINGTTVFSPNNGHGVLLDCRP